MVFICFSSEHHKASIDWLQRKVGERKFGNRKRKEFSMGERRIPYKKIPMLAIM